MALGALMKWSYGFGLGRVDNASTCFSSLLFNRAQMTSSYLKLTSRIKTPSAWPSLLSSDVPKEILPAGESDLVCVLIIVYDIQFQEEISTGTK